MRIVAIYIDEHDYMFNAPQTINFGGRYLYSFEDTDKGLNVSRAENSQFIEGFFQLTNCDTVLTNISAIVGQNGSGKSTILDIIRSVFINSIFALPQCKKLILCERINDHKPTLLINDFGEVHFTNSDEKLQLENTSQKLTSIYYSPHFDYKYNRNFDDYDKFDISFDKILEQDLSEIFETSSSENGLPYSPNQELLFRNSIRQIEFLSSELVKEKEIFKDLFQLPEHDDPLIEFRGYNENEKDWNTPYTFRTFINGIKEKTKKELDDWHKVRDTKKLDQIEVHKYLLKRHVVKFTIILIHRIFERSNNFLHEGDIISDELKKEFEEQDAISSLLLLIKTISISGKKVFSYAVADQLFRKLYELIDNVSNENEITQFSLRMKKEDAVELLVLQKNFISDLNRYYYLLRNDKEDAVYQEYHKVDGFIFYQPFSKNLSSGEHAILNLFSRLYSFIDINLKKIKYRELKDHFVLLLDEADLSFHPSWKKKYVMALLSTIPYFFDELEDKPSVQIIFTTHDPLTLSDIPNSNVVYLNSNKENQETSVLGIDDADRPQKTFGANISDLLADSFFIEDSLIGDFAKEQITNTIDWLKRKADKDNYQFYKSLISLIDEPIVKRKLFEMYDHKMGTKIEKVFIEEEIRKLQNRLDKLN